MNKTECVIHKTIEVPENARLFFVGDIHGQFDILQHLLQEVEFDFTKDYLISVGDLIDRGPKNLESLAYFTGSHPRRFACMGNHDAFMACAPFSENAYMSWMYNGGKWIERGGFSSDDLEIFSELVRTNMPVFLTVRHGKRKYGVVHAAVPLEYPETGGHFVTPNWDNVIRDVEMKSAQFADNRHTTHLSYWDLLSPFMWDRNVIEAPEKVLEHIPPVEGVDYVFHGHTFTPEIEILANRVHIDTGVAFNGVMTLVSPDLETGSLEAFTVNKLNPVECYLK